MQCSEYQVPGFRRGHGRLDGFQVAHFPHQNDVRVLAQCPTQRILKAYGVGADFTLNDDAFLVVVIKFDRVLDRDNVAGPLQIDYVDHGCQRRRLARTGRPGHQHQSARTVQQVFDRIRQTQLLEGQQCTRNLAQYRSEKVFLLEHADTKTGLIAEGEPEVDRTGLLNLLNMNFRGK
ncbi:hypothetical protein SDC9_158332 [bioreactor metagenome]|uniref:Uncharacterized protein n=1 Tax=bioreactor metagenome TaxID=1076179 RepID=A0A645F9Q9_9ZZZZ